MNPTAIALWLFCGGVGYLIDPTITSAVAGFVVGLGMSLIADFLDKEHS